MNNGWQTKTLDEISINLDSRRVPITKAARTTGEYPYYGASGIVDYVSDFIFDEDTLLVSEDGANLLARSSPIAFPASGKYWVNNHAHILKFENMTTQKFVELYLESIPLDDYVKGAAQPKLTQKALNSIPIPAPSLSEQQRIVGILDKAFEGIAAAKANAEKNLQNARSLFESYLQAIFAQRGEDWIEDKLLVLTTKIGSGATPLGGEEAYKTKGISLIRSLNVHDMGFRYEKLAFLDDAQAGGLSNVVVQPGDVLLNITGASITRCCLVPNDVLPARVNQHVSIIRPIADKLSPEFLHYLLISKPYKIQLLQTGEDGGSTRQALTKAQIQEFRVAHPKSLKQQQAIVARLNSLAAETERLASIYQRKLDSLKTLKKSLLHQAFTGQL
jgi:type I restriction enzyme S subunit